MAVVLSELPSVVSMEKKVAQRWIQNTATITVVPAAAVIWSFPRDCSGICYAYLHWSKLDQCNYIIKFIPTLQLQLTLVGALPLHLCLGIYLPIAALLRPSLCCPLSTAIHIVPLTH